MDPSPEAGEVVHVSAHMCGTKRRLDDEASNILAVPSEFTRLLTIMIADRLAERIAALGICKYLCGSDAAHRTTVHARLITRRTACAEGIGHWWVAKPKRHSCR
jgi:hypothetical protein